MANSYGLPLAAAFSLWAAAASAPVAQAQSVDPSSAASGSVVPSADGVGTVVTTVETANGSQFNIEQGTLSSDRVNQLHSFESFSLTATESANFIAPESVQNIVARVNGSAPSVINGLVKITDSGSEPNLYLMNSAGILLGPNASLNLPASFTATTADQIGFEQGWFGVEAGAGGLATGGSEIIDLEISGLETSESDLAGAIAGSPTGDFLFTQRSENRPSHSADATTGAIINEANLAVRAGQDLTLLGTSVTNTGQLSAPGGSVTLAAIPDSMPNGTQVQLRRPQGLLTLEFVPLESSLTDLSTTDIPSLLTQSEAHATDLTVGSDGSVALTRQPTLSSPLPTGTLFSSGSISSSSGISSNSSSTSSAAALSGGSVSLVGSTVALSGAAISASGATNGGSIRVGGDYRGHSALPAANLTIVDADTAIRADATRHGQGGRVVIWADDTTQYLGDISATGGAVSGDGGFVEVSGKRSLIFDGSVDTRAPNGETGMLLIDPENISIINGRSAPDDVQAIDGSILALETLDASAEGLLTISEGMLAALSGDTNVTLEASNDITIFPLNDQVLAFEPGRGEVILRADADGNGVGDIVMRDRETTLIAPGRNVTLSGANLLLGDINTVSTARSFQSGNITVEASESATLGDINAFSYLSGGRSGDVSITATDIISGDISTASLSKAGDITLIGRTGSIAVGEISHTALNGADGEATLAAPMSITVDGAVVQTVSAVSEAREAPSDTSVNAPSLTDTPTERQLLSSTRPLRSLGTLPAMAIFDTSTGDTADTEESAFSGSQSVVLSSAEANEAIAKTESLRTATFSDHFKRELNPTQSSLEEIQQQLKNAAQASGSRSAFVYVEAPTDGTVASATAPASTPLEMMIITADSPAIKVTLPHLGADELTATVTSFRNRLVTSARRGNDAYLSEAQQLYQWLIAPIETALETEVGAVEIDAFSFAMDDSLRALPIAALHDGEQFLVEKYGLGTLPSVGLTNLEYASLNDAQVMALGVSEFEQEEALPGVDLEIESIRRSWPGATLLNETLTKESLTKESLTQQRQGIPYQIIHLATHANFNAGALSDSYIQLWDEKLPLDELPDLGWHSPTVDLLILSACSTALGSASAELGFAGLAVASGARSAIASLWAIDDLATLAFMSELYQQLETAPAKLSALQATQLALLQGNVSVTDGQLVSHGSGDAIALPSELSKALSNKDLTHPYYWSGFTLIGNPW